MGFTLEERIVKHPGSTCAFIVFNKGRYLEFVHNPNKEKLDKRPGFSSGTKNNLKGLY